MARIVTISVVLSLLVITVGCQPVDTNRANQLPSRTTYVSPPLPTPAGGTPSVVNSSDVATLAEQVAKYRRDYLQSLVLLVDYYTSAGDNMKLGWAKEELQALKRMPQYIYLDDAALLPEDLHPTARIADADKLFNDAAKTEREAKPFGPLPPIDEGKLRVAREKFMDLIRQYPTSDKIAEAAWHAAEINRDLGNYNQAITLYKRTFQWDPGTSHDARYSAAMLLDRLGRRDEALPLYQDFVAKEGDRYPTEKMDAQRRIKELTGAPKP